VRSSASAPPSQGRLGAAATQALDLVLEKLGSADADVVEDQYSVPVDYGPCALI